MTGFRFLAAGLVSLAAVAADAGTLKCPADSVKVGNICVDRYEVSVWQIPTSNVGLIKRVQAGKATLADLTGGGATQLTAPPLCSPGFPPNFPADGNWTPVAGSNPPSPGVYAVSVPGVGPSTCITWFQANQACLLSGKRLLTNIEWQGAAAGTPDPGGTPGPNDCNTNATGPVPTGSRANCKSSWGAFGMVGNAGEWVADWQDRPQYCTDWTSQAGIPGNDYVCFGGTGDTGAGPGGFKSTPGVLVRGGLWADGVGAGVFAVASFSAWSGSANVGIGTGGAGFRCAR